MQGLPTLGALQEQESGGAQGLIRDVAVAEAT